MIIVLNISNQISHSLSLDMLALLASDSACTLYKHLKSVPYCWSWPGSASEFPDGCYIRHLNE